MHSEFRFPEHILHVIQSFLTSKEAAQSTALSKAWRSAWLTRPNLDFDFDDGKIDPKIIIELAEKTLRRYDNSNIKVESFRLYLNRTNDSAMGGRVTNLIVKALKIGATKLDLQLSRSDSDLPDAVFESENLVALTMKFGDIMDPVVIGCSMLQSLSLNFVRIQSLDVISHILSSCPLIMTLSLVNMYGYDPHCNINVAGLMTIHHHRLRSLVLDDVDFDTLFLGDLSSKFSSLKDLTLSRQYSSSPRKDTDIMISSRSLESMYIISLEEFTCRGKFDVPSIRKFTVESSTIPELSITSNSRGWESHVIIRSDDECFDASWFYRLGEFLKKFRLQSTSISLSLYASSTKSFDYDPGDIKGLLMPEIENLNIYHGFLPSLACYALFDGLFRMCRPKVITQYMCTRNFHYYSYSSLRVEANNIDFLGRALLRVLDIKIPASYHFMYGLNDLKEARAQVFDEAVSEWRDAPLDASSDHSKSAQHKHHRSYNPKVRFYMKWQAA